MPSVSPVSNTRVRGTEKLVSPAELFSAIPAPPAVHERVAATRAALRRALAGDDPRPIVIVGPCSIHDPAAALEYARRLQALIEALGDRLLLLMRVYFEKPRTTVGWKGLINDPDLNGSFNMDKGLRLARQLLVDLGELGVPAATEMLEPFTPQYVGDLVSWVAIGARTTESQTHRQMASGLSAPVGFKNSTDGNLQVAIDAVRSAGHPHWFLGIDDDGSTAVISTAGNEDAHLILRGGSDGTNYGAAEIEAAAKRLDAAGLRPRLLVDCSHANSGKKHGRQAMVWGSLIEQLCSARARGGAPSPIAGMMLESHLHEGRQDIPDDLAALRYGVSVTDECIDWEATEALLREGHARLR